MRRGQPGPVEEGVPRPVVSVPLLPLLGGEAGLRRGEIAGLEWDDAVVRWCLMYPDAYEVGVPNQGVMILYEVLTGDVPSDPDAIEAAMARRAA